MAIDSHELKNMRVKQVIATNVLLLAGILFYFILINALDVRMTHLFLILGIILFIHSISYLLKRDSTKSLIPIYEQVAIYEKQKMGSEWVKRRKAGRIGNLILCVLMFLQSYLYRYQTNDVVQIDYKFMLIMVIFIFVSTNSSLFIHFRKVDRATSELNVKGYTWKSTLIAVILGIVFGLVLIAFTIYYVFSGV